MSIVNTINNKLEQIANALLTNSVENLGLFDGKSGIALFLLYYGNYSKNKCFSDKAIDLIEQSLSEANPEMLTHCSGISGLGWTIQHIIEANLIDKTNDTILLDFDPIIGHECERMLKNTNYDYLHGGLGLLHYLINRNTYLSDKKQVTETISICISQLESTSIQEEHNTFSKWTSFILDDKLKKQCIFNLGLSHGMASIISVLCKSFNANILPAKCQSMVERTVNYILKYKQDFNLYGSFFPSTISLDESAHEPKNSRLAWCYGDLGIAIALMQASEILHDKNLSKLALNVLLKNAVRKDLEKEGVYDSGLCHGSAGIAQMYFRAFQKFKHPLLKKTYNYWINKTLELGNKTYSSTGYLSFQGKDDWRDSTSLLEGYAGIGMVLLNYIDPDIPSWDSCFLMQ